MRCLFIVPCLGIAILLAGDRRNREPRKYHGGEKLTFCQTSNDWEWIEILVSTKTNVSSRYPIVNWSIAGMTHLPPTFVNPLFSFHFFLENFRPRLIRDPLPERLVFDGLFFMVVSSYESYFLAVHFYFERCHAIFRLSDPSKCFVESKSLSECSRFSHSKTLCHSLGKFHNGSMIFTLGLYWSWFIHDCSDHESFSDPVFNIESCRKFHCDRCYLNTFFSHVFQ